MLLFMEGIDVEVALVALLYSDLLLDCSFPALLYCTHRLEHCVDTHP